MEPATQAGGPSVTGPSILPNDPRLARCGFAKLQGEGIEFFVRKYEITMGRTSKNSTLDLILGDSTTISRQHASIRYSFDTKSFELVVLGKNGVTVESSGSGATHLYTPDSPPTPLRTRDLLIMGEKRFYFLLPRAMGGQSRKRRRLEPSPVPGQQTHAGTVPAQHQHPAQPLTSSTPQFAIPQHAQPPHQATPVATAAPSAIGSGGCEPVSGTPNLPSQQPQDTPAHNRHPQTAKPQPVYAQMHAPGTVGGPAAGLPAQHQPYQMRQDEDALINASALPYDNGAQYGYGSGNHGFSGSF
ncbi:hypothetical protein Vretimale_2312 [Volvox reticuliferus]|uniref:Uncharacterized protein n=1 Tax=Volvox reticuliferus TaxID=1737510 RepID=A0A8J4C4V0_9CHLO|nr:hypothetical protein Vretifemale_4597 [Volvox reticuliferus]GIL96515.1 hypothetical protein Vretimale_2312 [Volvox reticuliferus]